jgi:type IX secretion system PorP/SprF family membrane protein
MDSHGQYFQFSQYNFSPQRINPALVSASDYAEASLLYRNQNTAGGFHINSNIVNASYPLINRNGKRWSGIGITFLNDKAGQQGLISHQEAGLTYAINISTSRYGTLALGFKGMYLRTSVNPDGLYTGSQYLEGHGFVESLSSGEDFINTSHSMMTFSSGMVWQETDQRGNILAYGGISIFDLNKPRDEFMQSSNRMLSTVVLNGGVRVYSSDLISIAPDLLITSGASRTVVNAGFVTAYSLKEYRKAPDDRIELRTHYVPGRSGILGIQVHKQNLSIGISYDFPLLKSNVANTGALEIGVEWRKLVDVKQRILARRKKQNATSAQRMTTEKKIPPTPVVVDSVSKPVDPKVSDVKVREDISTRLRHKQDSIQASAHVGIVQHEPLVLEKATLHFNFNFNSVDLDDEATAYFDDLAKALNDNPELKLKLVGHTDNVGSAKFNLRLSKDRADVIKEYLVSQGISEDRIESGGKGLAEPLNQNSTDAERAENRRVEMTILYQE